MYLLKKTVLFALFLLISAGVQTATAQTPVPLGMEDVVWQKNLTVYDLAFSPTQPYVAVGVVGEIVIYDIESGNELRKLSTSLNQSMKICFSKDGNFLYSGSDKGLILKWETNTWSRIVMDNLNLPLYEVLRDIAHNNQNNLLAVSSDQGLVLYNALTNEKVIEWKDMPIVDINYQRKAAVTSVSFRYDGKVIAIGMKDIDETWLYDIETKKIIKKIKGEDGLYSPTKNELILKKIKDSNGSELLDGLDYYKFDESENPINININILYKDIKFIFNSEGNKMIVTGIKSNIKFYDLLNIQNIKEFTYEQSGSFFFLSLSNNDDYLLAGNFGEILLISSGDYLNVLKNNIQYINISPNPTNDIVNIEYSLTYNTNIQITISDLQGVFLGELFDGFLESGVHSINYPILNLPSGAYFININVNGSISSKKFEIIR